MIGCVCLNSWRQWCEREFFRTQISRLIFPHRTLSVRRNKHIFIKKTWFKIKTNKRERWSPAARPISISIVISIHEHVPGGSSFRFTIRHSNTSVLLQNNCNYCWCFNFFFVLLNYHSFHYQSQRECFHTTTHPTANLATLQFC